MAFGFAGAAAGGGVGAAMCAFDVSAIMCVVSAGAIFIESAILIDELSAATLLFCAFLHAPAAMTTTATAKAMRFMRAPV